MIIKFKCIDRDKFHLLCMSQIIIVSLFSIFFIALFSFFLAVIVQCITKIVAKFTPTNCMTYKATLFGFIVLLCCCSLIIAMNTMSSQVITLILVIGFFIRTAIYASIIKTPVTGSIGFSKACLISLVQLPFDFFLLVFIIPWVVFLIAALMHGLASGLPYV
ncbi:MAG: hypothetical protein D3903_12695 [Candidatus Electrothrix sp. GM3_4]|nr:hypothetical protein [Candidatus Electrothrix sp. GM3_4]